MSFLPLLLYFSLSVAISLYATFAGSGIYDETVSTIEGEVSTLSTTIAEQVIMNAFSHCQSA